MLTVRIRHLLGLIVAGCCVCSTDGQSTAQLATTTLQEEAQTRIERGALADAVPYLEELDRRLRESTDSAAVRSRELVLFHLGLGQLQSAKLTTAATTLAERRLGDRVNLEADLLAKYTERLLLAGGRPAAAAPAQDLSASWLAEHGWG